MRPDISEELVKRATEKWKLENGISADIPMSKIIEDILLKFVEGSDTITRKVKDKLFRQYMRIKYGVNPIEMQSSVTIDSTRFGYVTVNDKEHESDVVVSYKGMVEEIKTEMRHLLTRRELNILLLDYPKIIIVGIGQDGLLEISSEFRKIAKQRNIEILEMKTPEAIKKFNQLYKNGEKVSAYIHVTC